MNTDAEKKSKADAQNAEKGDCCAQGVHCVVDLAEAGGDRSVEHPMVVDVFNRRLALAKNEIDSLQRKLAEFSMSPEVDGLLDELHSIKGHNNDLRDENNRWQIRYAEMRETDAELAEVQYLARTYAQGLLSAIAPDVEPEPDLMGLLTQIDNWCAGQVKPKAVSFCEILWGASFFGLGVFLFFVGEPTIPRVGVSVFCAIFGALIVVRELSRDKKGEV